MNEEPSAAREALDRLAELTETKLFRVRHGWIGHDISLTEIRDFVKDAIHRVREARSAVGNGDPLDTLATDLNTLSEQFDHPTGDNWVTVIAALAEISVLLPEVRAWLLQYAQFGDPLSELASKIIEQRAVTTHLTEDLNSVTRTRENHRTAMIKQAELNGLVKYRYHVVDGRWVKVPAVATAIPDTDSYVDGLNEVVATLTAQLVRAENRLARLEKAQLTAR